MGLGAARLAWGTEAWKASLEIAHERLWDHWPASYFITPLTFCRPWYLLPFSRPQFSHLFRGWEQVCEYLPGAGS